MFNYVKLIYIQNFKKVNNLVNTTMARIKICQCRTMLRVANNTKNKINKPLQQV